MAGVSFRGAGALTALVAVIGLAFGHLLQPFDFLTFLHAGRDVLDGRIPYASPSSPVFTSGHAFVYPLYVAWVFAPLAALPLWCAESLYASASVVAIVASCRLLGRRGGATAGLVLACSTTIVGLQMGTLNAFLLLGLAFAWRFRRSRPLLAGVVLGVAATAKLFLLPVLLWPVMRRRFGQATAAVGTVVALMGLSAGLGPFSPLSYIAMMSKLDAREQVQSWSLSSLVQGIGAGRTWATVVAVLAAAGCVVAIWWRRRVLSDGQVLAAVVLCSLLVSPILWSSYLLLLVVPLILVPLDNRLLAVFAVCSWAIVTPDAASPLRCLLGALVAAGLAAWALRFWIRRCVDMVARPALRRLAVLAAAALGFGLAMVALPAPARSPLPAVAAIVVVAAWCLRPSRSDVAVDRVRTG